MLMEHSLDNRYIITYIFNYLHIYFIIINIRILFIV